MCSDANLAFLKPRLLRTFKSPFIEMSNKFKAYMSLVHFSHGDLASLPLANGT